MSERYKGFLEYLKKPSVTIVVFGLSGCGSVFLRNIWSVVDTMTIGAVQCGWVRGSLTASRRYRNELLLWGSVPLWSPSEQRDEVFQPTRRPLSIVLGPFLKALFTKAAPPTPSSPFPARARCPGARRFPAHHLDTSGPRRGRL